MLASVFKPKRPSPLFTGLDGLLSNSSLPNTTMRPWYLFTTTAQLSLWQQQHPTVKALAWHDNVMPHEARRLLATVMSPFTTQEQPLLLTVENWLSSAVQQALQEYLTTHASPADSPTHYWHEDSGGYWQHGIIEDPEAYRLAQRFTKQWAKLSPSPLFIVAEQSALNHTPTTTSPMVFWGLSNHSLIKQLQTALSLVKQHQHGLTGWFNTGIPTLTNYSLGKLEQAITQAGWHVRDAKQLLHTPTTALDPLPPLTMVLALTPAEQSYYPLWQYTQHTAGQSGNSLTIHWQDPLVTPNTKAVGLHWVCHSKENYHDRLKDLITVDKHHKGIKPLKHQRHNLIHHHKAHHSWLPTIVQQGLNHLLY
jgi:hypothetical protein